MPKKNAFPNFYKDDFANVDYIETQALSWYDNNKRDLPWRLETPVAYFVYLSEMMLQQTTVKTATPYFNRFVEQFKTFSDLLTASQEDILNLWQGLGYYTRARAIFNFIQICNQKKITTIPSFFEDLIDLPGIGPYTAKAVLAIAYNKPYFPVDGNVIRVLSRVYGLEIERPKLDKKIQEYGLLFETHSQKNRYGDLAQSFMDLGSQICKPKTPLCDLCPLQKICTLKQHSLNPEHFPKKPITKEKPRRFGILYLLTHRDKILIEKKKEGDTLKGNLLKGLYQFPTTRWDINLGFYREEELNGLIWSYLGELKHTFSHFFLFLDIYRAETTKNDHVTSEESFWIDKEDLDRYPFSTLMRKAVKFL
jgi:A/G-specific adenine glycosylase